MQTTLWGWGAQRRVTCDLRAPETVDDLARAVDPGGSIARGMGRSYGDNALNEHRRVVGMPRFDRYLAFDEATGRLTCEAGVTLRQIIHDFAPRGWFPLITPGTKHVTVGGCIANDVHGKAHHAQGSFERSVESMRILLGDGRVVQASRTERPDLFWTTLGGLGLTGIVIDATLWLRRIETTWFRQHVFHARDLTEMLELMAETDGTWPYSVANIDFVATGAQMGRGVLVVGDHATRDVLTPSLARKALALDRGARIDVPFELPELAFNGFTRKIINQVILGSFRLKGSFSHFDSFFYPLDVISRWNHGYGHSGFIQYQFVLPMAAGPGPLRALMETIMGSGQLPFLNVLKRMGPGNEAPLSFPFEGYTFAIDFPIRDGLRDLVTRLDAMVIDAGGRVYLGKDSFLTAGSLRRMYPQVELWLAAKAKWDPKGVFTSDMGRRLGLSP